MQRLGDSDNRDAEWQKFVSIFNLQKTPPMKYVEPQIPGAPKKVKTHIHREGLKPRKLIYEPEDAKRSKEKPASKVWEDSGIALWASSSATLEAEDADKENRPESGKMHKSRGMSRAKNADRVRDRGQKDAHPKPAFRFIRI